MQTAMRALLLGDCNDVLDEEGRPVGEVRASSAVRGACRTTYTMCPYPGSRQRATRTMNASALDQLHRVWPQPLRLLAGVRRLHGLGPGEPAPLLTLCRVGFTVLCLPAWLAYRSTPGAAGAPVPVTVAVAHKMAQGLFGLCKNFLIDTVAGGGDYREAMGHVGTLYRFAERSGILHSRTGIEACAAPPDMIGAALRMLVLGADGEADAEADPLADVLTDEDGQRLLAYATAVADMTVWTTVAAIALRSVVERTAGMVDLAEYRLTGFRDAVVGAVVELPAPIREQYALGAAALGSSATLRMRLNRVLERVGSGAGVMACEIELLDIFYSLQEGLLTALGRPPLQPGSLRAALTDAFGRLPSSYLLRSDAFAETWADMGLTDV